MGRQEYYVVIKNKKENEPTKQIIKPLKSITLYIPLWSGI